MFRFSCRLQLDISHIDIELESVWVTCSLMISLDFLILHFGRTPNYLIKLLQKNDILCRLCFVRNWCSVKYPFAPLLLSVYGRHSHVFLSPWTTLIAELTCLYVQSKLGHSEPIRAIAANKATLNLLSKIEACHNCDLMLAWRCCIWSRGLN